MTDNEVEVFCIICGTPFFITHEQWLSTTPAFDWACDSCFNDPEARHSRDKK